MSLSQAAAVLAFVSLSAWPCPEVECPPPAGAASGIEFAGKIVMVRMRKTSADGRFTDGYLERAEIRRFGDSAFVVGTLRRANHAATKSAEDGVRIWLPLAEVAEMAEFKDYGTVEKSLTMGTEIAPDVDPGEITLVNPPVLSVVTSSRRFRIPFRLADQSRRTAKVILFRSQDEGKTWRPVSERVEGDTTFTVSVEEDGTNWFAVQVIGKDGRKWPADLESLKPVRKVTVVTPEKKEIRGTLARTERLEPAPAHRPLSSQSPDLSTMPFIASWRVERCHGIAPASLIPIAGPVS